MTQIVPLLTFATIGVVFTLCALAFRSVMLPLRLLATIALTIGSVFGAANLVFRYVFRMDGLYWLVYPVGTPILIGIVIDYDVLLVSRIFEYRATHRFATRAAVLRGLRRTGSTITLAGVIMMLAFGAFLPRASVNGFVCFVLPLERSPSRVARWLPLRGSALKRVCTRFRPPLFPARDGSH